MRSFARLAACLFAMTAVTASAAPSELKWRRGGVDHTTSTPATSSLKFQSATTRAPRPANSSHTSELNPLRSAPRRLDTAVRQAAFEDTAGPQFEPSEGRLQFRSVIVRGEETGAVRSAQLPAEPTTPGLPLDEDFGTPGIEPPGELPPLEERPLEELQTPSPIEEPPLQLDENQRQPFEQQPMQDVPLRRPPLDVLPGGPLPEDAPPLPEETIEEEREKALAACEEGFEDLKAKTIDKLDISIAVEGEPGADIPFECTLEDAEFAGRCWDTTIYTWKASALCHKPLYFEDEQLERYGHSFSPAFQPFVSGAHFFTRLPVLPYCMGVEPPTECIYALGHYRPGNCAPYMCNPIPVSPRGALIQAGAATGTAFALP